MLMISSSLTGKYEDEVAYFKYFYEQVEIGLARNSNKEIELWTFEEFFDDATLCMLIQMRYFSLLVTVSKAPGEKVPQLITLADEPLSNRVDKKLQLQRRQNALKDMEEWSKTMNSWYTRFVEYMSKSNSKYIVNLFDHYVECGGKSREDILAEYGIVRTRRKDPAHA